MDIGYESRVTKPHSHRQSLLSKKSSLTKPHSHRHFYRQSPASRVTSLLKKEKKANQQIRKLEIVLPHEGIMPIMCPRL